MANHQAATKWQPVETMPVDTPVTIKSAKGIVCLAKVRGDEGYIRGPDSWGPRRRHCARLDGKTSGDIFAVKWREGLGP